MRKIISMLCIFVLTVIVLCGCNDSSGDSEKQKELIKSDITEDKGKNDAAEEVTDSPVYDEVQDFSYNLLKYNMNKNNPVLSPASAYIALSMAGNGAKGKTLEQFQEVLSEDLLTIPTDLMDKLPREDKKVGLTLANSAWIDEVVDVNDDWAEKIEKSFQADIYKQDLATNKTMEKVNKWVDKNTGGLIDKMLDKPLGEDVCLVLFNALYFKAEWQSKFDAQSTHERDFYPEEGNNTRVNMMHMFGENQLYIKNDVAEGVILPYTDENLVFMALRPSTDRDYMTVREMYEALTWEDISGFLQQEDTTLCNLVLPKFQVEFDEKLNDSLINMGLSDAFDPDKADLSGLGQTESGNEFYISLVRQKALVIVDEEGTEAAAVTEVVAIEKAAMMETEPVDIYFDRPFFYMIVDKNMQVPLFMGIMDCPKN